MRPQAVALRGIGRVAQRDALRKGTFGWLPGVTKVELLLRNLVAAVGLEPTTYGLCVANRAMKTKKISDFTRQNPANLCKIRNPRATRVHHEFNRRRTAFANSLSGNCSSANGNHRSIFP
jgi:hypothetical protein